MKTFKATQIYGWDEEPVDERPSEFSPSGGQSVLSGYSTPARARVPQRRHPRRHWAGVLVFCSGLCGFGFWALLQFPALLRH